jgi:hypothetical protein
MKEMREENKGKKMRDERRLEVGHLVRVPFWWF